MQRRIRRIIAGLAVLSLAIPFAQAAPRGQETTWEDLLPEQRAKVDPRILAEFRGEVVPTHLDDRTDRAGAAVRNSPPSTTRFLVYLKPQVDLGAFAQRDFATKADRRAAVFDALVATARASQKPVEMTLRARTSRGSVTAYQPFYIFNGFAVEGDLSTVAALARRDDVDRIVANYALVLPEDDEENPASAIDAGIALHPDNWNIDLVDADRVWNELGITGEGAVVGGIDTGVWYTHPALVGQYRGNLGGGSFDHNYSWFDPDDTLYAGGDLGPSRTTAPFDTGEHGTHTMGTMVGDGTTFGTQVGMAPGAEWIAVSLNSLVVDGSMADDIIAHKAFQWMLCPTDLTGALSTADCSKAPDVVNNSWGSANPAADVFRPDIQALRAAGIAPVFASGNPSAGAGSIGSPGSAPEAITVGATSSSDVVASFSGRGPSFYEGEQKPELTAPGVTIKSTVPGGGYESTMWSGTSMAAPHVAGLVALMVSADLDDGSRDFDVDELERFMAYTAVDLGAPGPDDDYGYGRIDAYHAVRWVLSAGDLQGTVREDGTLAPIPGAQVTGVGAGAGDTFASSTGAGGQYSTTVPAGVYTVTAEAWGYYSDTVSGRTVITGAVSTHNFELAPLPTATVTGAVRSGAIPISGARVYVAAAPAVSFTTGADGRYTMTLPIATHGMLVEATGYRILREDVTVGSGGSGHDFAMTEAPTILLVDADTYTGYFAGWPVHGHFEWALEEENYLYDLWIVQSNAFNDTQVMADGSVWHGIPSLATLNSYDVVVWAHGGGGEPYVPPPSPGGMGADDELMAYLDGGGRLVISGQDLGQDDGTTFYDEYLRANRVANSAAAVGDTVSGQDLFAGLSLTITNASLHGYPNGATSLSPDAVSGEDEKAVPILTYAGGTAAALAVGPCERSYRAVYLAVGYENIAPRGANRDPDIAEVLDRSIGWVADPGPACDFDGSYKSAAPQYLRPGDRITYTVTIFADPVELPGASLVDPIPAGTTFAGFVANPIGATYNGAGDRVEWSGTVLANADPMTFSFGVDLAASGWANGDLVTNTITFDGGDGQVYTKTIVSEVVFPDLSLSTKTASASRALAGDVLTYTINLEYSGPVNEVVTVRDPLPSDVAYIPSSLNHTIGTAGYDEPAQAVTWTLTLGTWGKVLLVDDDDNSPDVRDYYTATLDSLSVDYDVWDTANSDNEPNAATLSQYTCVIWFAGDSWGSYAGPGTAGSAALGTYLDSGGCLFLSSQDYLYARGGMTPFAQTYFGLEAYSDLVYHTVVTGTGDVYGGYGPYSLTYPFVNFSDLVGPDWTAEVALIGNRGDPPYAAISKDNGIYRTIFWGFPFEALPSAGTREAMMEATLEWLGCRQSSASLSFAVTTAAPLPVNTWITNTATITSSFTTIHRSAGTAINVVDLSDSAQTADRPWATVGQEVTYDFTLKNTGLVTATGAVLTDTLPAHTAYVGGSVACSDGVCDYGAGDVTWTGDVPPGETVTVTFAVTLTNVLTDRTPVTNTAYLNDGYGNIHELDAVFLARSSILSSSYKIASPAGVERGDTVTYTVYIHNSGSLTTTGEMEDQLPPRVTYQPGSLFCDSGSCGYATGVITWTGVVTPDATIEVQYRVTVDAIPPYGEAIVNSADIVNTAWGVDCVAEATVTVEQIKLYFPVVVRIAGP